MRNEEMPSRRSVVEPELQYTTERWVVSILNTGAGFTGKLFEGHSVIVVEGLKTAQGMFSVTSFIGQYDISAIPEEGASSINTKGIITKIRTFESEEPQKDYTPYPHKSFTAESILVQRMIDEIKRDELVTKKAMENLTRRAVRQPPLHVGSDGEEIKPLRYQKLGASHPLVLLLGSSEDGENCASWCQEKLSVAGINAGGLPKPAKVAGCSML